MAWLTPWPGNRTLLRSLAPHDLSVTYGQALHGMAWHAMASFEPWPWPGLGANFGQALGGPWRTMNEMVRSVQGVGKGIVLFEIADESRQGGAGLAVEGFVKLGAYGAWFEVELNGWLSHAVADRNEAGSRVDHA